MQVQQGPLQGGLQQCCLLIPTSDGFIAHLHSCPTREALGRLLSKPDEYLKTIRKRQTGELLTVEQALQLSTSGSRVCCRIYW